MDEEGEKLYTQWCQLLSEKKKDRMSGLSLIQMIKLYTLYIHFWQIVLYMVVLFTLQWAADTLKTTWAKYFQKLRTFNHYWN